MTTHSENNPTIAEVIKALDRTAAAAVLLAANQAVNEVPLGSPAMQLIAALVEIEKLEARRTNG